MINFKGHRIEKDIILLCVRWYLAYPLSYRHLEDNDGRRGVQVDHSNIYRWVQKFTPPLEAAFRNDKKRPVGSGWRMNETYTKVKGQWKYLYRAIDREGPTIDFLLTAHRDKKAALRFLKRAVRHHGLPEKITIDQAGPIPRPSKRLSKKPVKKSRSVRISI
jgi:putative transposase